LAFTGGKKGWWGIEVPENFEGYPDHFGAKDLLYALVRLDVKVSGLL